MIKYSQFNSTINYNGQIALFNSFTKKVILILPELNELLKAAKVEGIQKLQLYHPTFYDFLLNEKFLVPISLNEVQEVKEIANKVDNDQSIFILTINPTMNCNFKCWYCYETHIKKSSINDDLLLRIKLFISSTASKPNIKDFSLSFFGGEPLLNFHQSVVPLINHFKSECIYHDKLMNISFTTNGYLVDEKFINFFKEQNLSCALQITLDGFGKDHDAVRNINSKKGSYKKIIENIRLLIQNGFFVRLRINYTKSNINNSYLIGNEFIDLPQEILNENLLFDFHKVWQEEDDDKVNHEADIVMDKLRKMNYLVSSNLVANNVLESCYADKRNSVTINYNGDIYKCTARDFNFENRAGFLDETGELIWENDSLENRMNIKFKNKPCLSCRILPICNGGCSQHAIEMSGQEYCIYDGNDIQKDIVVLRTIETILGAESRVVLPDLTEVNY